MPTRKRERSYYKVTFTNENELYQLCVRELATSDLYGLIEIGDFIFPENRLVYNPGEERLKREFEGIRRTWIPYHAIVRIDEVVDMRESESKIIPLQSMTPSPKNNPIKTQDA